MAKGEYKKIARPEQDGYEIVLTPESHKVSQVRIRFGTKVGVDEDGDAIYKWDLTVGPFEVNPDQSKKLVMQVDADQLPASPHKCFYQMLCEIDDGKEPTGTLLTEPTSLTAVNTTQSDFEQRSKVVQTAIEGVFVNESSSTLPTTPA